MLRCRGDLVGRYAKDSWDKWPPSMATTVHGITFQNTQVEIYSGHFRRPSNTSATIPLFIRFLWGA
jgi:hypothetical protein